MRILLVILALLAFPGCRGKKDEDASNDHLKSGLLALDRGDDITAERELTASLDAKPKNGEARLALASIYAKRAGFPLNVWLEPLLEAGKQVDSKMRTYAGAGDISRKFEDKDPDFGISPLASHDPQDPGLVELRKRIQNLYESLGKVATGTMVAIDLFEGLPYLESAQMDSLDRAIQVLREDDPNPDLRQPKVKVYLAALALMKFIHQVRGFVGGVDHDMKKIFTSTSTLCALDGPEAKARVYQIHESLLLVEEGLRVSPGEVSDGRLKGREQLHDFVQKKLLGSVWDDVEKFYISGSEQNYAVLRFVGFVCSRGRDGSKPALPGGPTGAHLWNPDDDSETETPSHP